MKIHIIQHVPFESPGSLTSWISQPNNFTTFSRPYEAEWYPALDCFDLCIVLGGPMSARDTQLNPWLARELDFLEKAVKKRKKMLGIFLGVQLIARVLGGAVYQNLYREIGWHPVRLTPAAKNLPMFERFPDSWMAFHWHQDTFAIPPMGYRIEETDGCPNAQPVRRMVQRLGSCGSAGFITIAPAEGIRSHANESHVNWDNGISPIIR